MSADFFDIEKFQFSGKGRLKNSVEIGRTPDGQWTYGIDYVFGNALGANGLSVFGKMFSDRKECLIAAIKELRRLHVESIKNAENDYYDNYDPKLNRKVIKECDKFLFDLKFKQLELFYEQ